MPHYPDQYEADAARQNQHKTHLFYSNKINSIQKVIDRVQQELEVPILNEIKIQHMLDQINCLSDIKDT